MNDQLLRIRALMDTGRYEDAERDLRVYLMRSPDDALAHTWLAHIILEQDKSPIEAVRAAMTAVSLEPQQGFTHAMLAYAFEKQGKLRDAEAAVREAIRIDPYNADYYARLAAIYIRSSHWSHAADTAECGLKIDPDNIPCVNLRAVALRQMGKRDDAAAAIETALSLDPTNAASDANQGWLLLDKGDPNAAIPHFREALRLDPQYEWARTGILEALRARNPVYRFILRYFLWMGKLPPQIRWGVIIGGYFLSKVLSTLASSYPALAPVALVLLGLYVLFAYLTWTVVPVSSLLLRFDPVGRILLTPPQIQATNAVAACLIAAIVLIPVSLFLANIPLLGGAIAAALLLVPLSGFFKTETARGRLVVGIYTGLMALVAAFGVVTAMMGLKIGDTAAMAFLGMLMIYFWGGNLVLNRL